MSGLRADARAILDAALAAVEPYAATARALKRRGPVLEVCGRAFDLDAYPGVTLVAVGKAAPAMAEAALAVVGDWVDRAVVVTTAGCARTVPGAELVVGAHPIPDASSVAAADRVVEVVSERPLHLTLFLISGGTSALLCRPVGRSLSEVQALYRDLLVSGRDIASVNAERTSFSAVKGGRLAALAPQRATLVLSDVPGDDPSVVGSGPTILPGDPVAVVASNGTAAAAAQKCARGLGYRAHPARPATGPAAVLGRHIATVVGSSPGGCHVWGGETTVVVRGAGRGGRNHEVAAAAIPGLEGVDAVVLAAATDGVDGPSGAAGGFADGTSAQRCRELGLDPAAAVRDNDTAPLLEALGDQLVLGPTGTNVMDLIIALRR